MASTIDTAHEFFGLAIDTNFYDALAVSAGLAEDHNIKSTTQVDAAMLLLRDLIFRADGSDFTREIGNAYIEGAMALLLISSANARAVELYLSGQAAKERAVDRRRASAGSEPAASAYASADA